MHQGVHDGVQFRAQGGLGLGLSTGEAAAALLGSEERLEYTLVGDTVNMSQRLQQLAEAGEIVVSQGTVDAWETARETVALPAQLVKGRETPVIAYKLVDDGCRTGDVLAKEGT